MTQFFTEKAKASSLEGFLDKRKAEGSFRSLKQVDHLIDFASNDYLGMAGSALLRQKVTNDLAIQNAVGSTSARLISGNSSLHREVEQQVINFHNAEAGLLFNSGYDANLGLLSSVPQKNDVVFYDELVHASIHDGLKLSRAPSVVFPHNDLSVLEAKLLQTGAEQKYIVVESLYSMDGDLAPLDELIKLCNRYDARLIVDEAHATGIYGTRGEGRVQELGLEAEVFARVHTFGKALGGSGAIILGSQNLIDFLVNFSRSFIYTTALPVASLLAIKYAYELLPVFNRKVKRLNQLIDLFRSGIHHREALLNANGPIQSVVIPGNDRAKKLSLKLEEAGYYSKAILYPTVPRGSERLRICIHAFNTTEQVKGLTTIINENQ